jgi:hypothetical protein
LFSAEHFPIKGNGKTVFILAELTGLEPADIAAMFFGALLDRWGIGRKQRRIHE